MDDREERRITEAEGELERTSRLHHLEPFSLGTLLVRFQQLSPVLGHFSMSSQPVTQSDRKKESNSSHFAYMVSMGSSRPEGCERTYLELTQMIFCRLAAMSAHLQGGRQREMRDSLLLSWTRQYRSVRSIYNQLIAHSLLDISSVRQLSLTSEYLI